MGIAEKVAQRFFEDRYARLLQAMSMGEAKTILGFPPGSSPTPQEVSKAYKRQSFENHPDRGGSHDKMVEINVAKDILTGERSPTGPGGQRQRPARPSTPYKQRPDPPPMKGNNFSQALSGVPSGVDWKFVSGAGYQSDMESHEVDGESFNYHRYYYGWVAYGQTETHHVFVGVQAKVGGNLSPMPLKQAIQEGSVEWQGFHIGAKRSLNLIRLAPKMVKQILAGLPGLKGSRVLPKKYKVMNGPLTVNILTQGSAGLSLKDAIIGSGAMPAGSAGLKGRKAVITIDPVFDRVKYKKLRDEGARGTEYHQAYNWVVEVNGRGRELKDDEVERLSKNNFLSGVYSYDYEKGKKNLTRLRGGFLSFGAADAIRLLAEALNSGSLKAQITAAAEQMTAAKKATRDLFASMPLHDVALLEGEPLLTLFTETLYG